MSGGGGIRTHETPEGPAVFKTAAFVRSATPPCLSARPGPQPGLLRKWGPNPTAAVSEAASRRPPASSKTCRTSLPRGVESDQGQVAEGVGFEPTGPEIRPNSFRDCRLRPLGHPSMSFARPGPQPRPPPQRGAPTPRRPYQKPPAASLQQEAWRVGGCGLRLVDCDCGIRRGGLRHSPPRTEEL